MALEAFLTFVIHNLSSMIQKQVGLLFSVDRDMEKLQSTLSTIKSVIEDAEEKQVRDKAIKDWLRKLRDAAYDLDDVLDDFAIEAARFGFRSQQSGGLVMVTSCMIRLSPNNVLFHHKIANKMKDVEKRLDRIAEERTKFHLQQVTDGERGEDVLESRETSSIITQPVVYGRGEDQEKIVKYMVDVATVPENISVYPIVGIGGVGKTTLAQLVFNDERVESHFELRSWVCVSENFNIKRVTKAIIESISGISCEALDLDLLQRQLQEKLKGRRYLIVLDDIWNEDQEKWDSLKCVLECGAKRSSILVTTRLNSVAEIVRTRTTSAHHLSGLSNDDCWSLFKERAFGHEEGQESHSLEALGKELVRKCAGVPLAAKVLGSTMRSKKEESQWRNVLESELWNLPEDGNNLLPVLRLSYINLPSKLRRYFAYCAVFPKGYKIDKRLLVHLWQANGFISPARNLDAEDIGNEICSELYWKSLFQDVEKDEFGKIINFKMHDLVHDLAQSIMEGECCPLEPGRPHPSPERSYHVMIPDYPKEFWTFFGDVYKLKSLRTLHVDWNNFSQNCWKKLSSSIRNLRHLRYLDLSYSEIRSLPKSICSLWNLQNLKLDKCSYLKKLPNRIKLLKNLEHLSIRGCSSLSYLPPNIGRLTCLKTLSIFIVGERRGCHLAELQKLDLRGDLFIKHLEKVRDPMEANKANLAEKSNLRELGLSWKINNESEELQGNCEGVLESLKPHGNIKSLKIEEYRGTCFPRWMSEAIHGNLVSVKLIRCCNCKDLPPIGKLPNLKHLTVEGNNFVQYLDNECHNGVGQATQGFPSLETLRIRDLGNLERLARDERRELLRRLTMLDVVGSPKLSCLPSCLTALTSFTIRGCVEVGLFNSISNLSSLNSLLISGYNDKDVITFPDGMLRNLTALQHLSIRECYEIKALPGELVGEVNSLEVLSIWHCVQLESLPEQGLQDLNSLRSLEIAHCFQLKSMSEGIRRLTSLERLTIKGCPKLNVLSDDIRHLLSLRYLSVWSLPAPALLNILEGLTHVPKPALRALQIGFFNDLESLPNSLCNLTSLQSLHVDECPSLTSIPTTMHKLTNLNELRVDSSPELVRRCQKPTGEDWHKIAYIPRVSLDGKLQI